MKVLIVHTTYKLKGGEDSVVANETDLLNAAGVETSVLQFSNTGSTLLKVAQMPFNFGSYRATKQKIREFKPDIVHIHNLHFAGSASVILAIKKFKIPIVFTLHNYRLLCPSATLFYNGAMFTDSLTQNFPLNAIKKGVYLNSKPLTFWLGASLWLHQALGTWQKIDKFIALGQHTKEIFANSKLNSIADKIVIKPNFCFKSIEYSTSGEYYLYVGRLSEEKGVNVLLKAFEENGLPLKIAGTGPMENEVIGSAQTHTNIQFVGSVDKEMVNSLMGNAKALIFPSQWYETFGMVIIEAFSAGVPVIASNLGQLKFTVNDQKNGLLFESGNEDDLNKKLYYFESLSSEQIKHYKEGAFNSYSEKYSPEINTAALLSIYSNLINRAI